ncbi:LysM peptidoglycan-binding domain-containing protein [Treponema sp. R80B11-R83G3]
MKKILLVMALVLSIMLVMGCKSTPPTDDDYVKLYDKSTGLILDGAKTYTVKSGDTLSDIARTEMGNGFYYPIIMLASRGVVVNPDKILPGMELTIIDGEKNKADDNARKSMKNYFLGFVNFEKSKAKPDQRLINGFKKEAGKL